MNKQIELKDLKYKSFILVFLLTCGFAYKICHRLNIETIIGSEKLLIIILLFAFIFSFVFVLFECKTTILLVDENGNLIVLQKTITKTQNITYDKNLINDFCFKTTMQGLVLVMNYLQSSEILAKESDEKAFLNAVCFLINNFPEKTEKIKTNKVIHYLETGKIKYGFFEKCLLFLLIIIIVLVIIGGIFSAMELLQ